MAASILPVFGIFPKRYIKIPASPQVQNLASVLFEKNKSHNNVLLFRIISILSLVYYLFADILSELNIPLFKLLKKYNNALFLL